MKKRAIKILSLISTVIIVCGYLLYRFHFPHTGSRSGQVINAVTGKPIEGVVVSYCWVFSPVMGSNGPAATFETTTNEDGRYFIPSQEAVCPIPLLYGPLQRDKVLIYKDSYAAFMVFHDDDPQLGKSFGYKDYKQPYREKNNIVKLYPWKQGESHYNHIDFIDAMTRSCGQGELLKKELGPERNRAREERLMERAEKTPTSRDKQ